MISGRVLGAKGCRLANLRIALGIRRFRCGYAVVLSCFVEVGGLRVQESGCGQLVQGGVGLKPGDSMRQQLSKQEPFQMI